MTKARLTDGRSALVTASGAVTWATTKRLLCHRVRTSVRSCLTVSRPMCLFEVMIESPSSSISRPRRMRRSICCVLPLAQWLADV